MANRKAPIRQADLRRYIAAIVAAGVPVGKIMIGPDGTVTILAAGEADASANPCDRLLD